jgi:hypothetical protein
MPRYADGAAIDSVTGRLAGFKSAFYLDKSG